MGRSAGAARTLGSGRAPQQGRGRRREEQQEEDGKEEPGKEDAKKKRVLKPRVPRPKLTLELLKVRGGAGKREPQACARLGSDPMPQPLAQDDSKGLKLVSKTFPDAFRKQFKGKGHEVGPGLLQAAASHV